MKTKSSHLSPADPAVHLCLGLRIYEVLFCRLIKDAPTGASVEAGRGGR